MLGEGPLWWPERQCLLFVDIKAPALLTWSASEGGHRYPLPAEIGCIVHRRAGGFIGALREGITEISLAPVATRTLFPFEPELPSNRPNDGKCDPQGRFWVASMDDAVQAPSGAIWRINTDLTLDRMASGYIVGNGFGWNRNASRMYFTDSEKRTIFAYDFDPVTGSLGERHVFVQTSDDAGYPDGLCVDAEDYVWSAHWDGARVTRYRPDGRVDRVVQMPVLRPTSVAFGGADLNRLYITSASIGLDEAQLASYPLSGGLFEIDVGVQGVPESKFGG